MLTTDTRFYLDCITLICFACITIVWRVSNTRLFCKVSNNPLIIQVFDELAKDSIYRIEETDIQKDAETIY